MIIYKYVWFLWKEYDKIIEIIINVIAITDYI